MPWTDKEAYHGFTVGESKSRAASDLGLPNSQLVPGSLGSAAIFPVRPRFLRSGNRVLFFSDKVKMAAATQRLGWPRAAATHATK